MNDRSKETLKAQQSQQASLVLWATWIIFALFGGFLFVYEISLVGGFLFMVPLPVASLFYVRDRRRKLKQRERDITNFRRR